MMIDDLWELFLLYVVLLEGHICQVAGSCRNSVRAEGLEELTFILLFMPCNSLTFDLHSCGTSMENMLFT